MEISYNILFHIQWSSHVFFFLKTNTTPYSCDLLYDNSTISMIYFTGPSSISRSSQAPRISPAHIDSPESFEVCLDRQGDEDDLHGEACEGRRQDKDRP